MANETDYAYAAGIIDGDGCIGIYKNKAKSCISGYRYCLSIRVGMSDQLVPLWLKLTFGGSLSSGCNLGWGNLTMHKWALGSNQALDFLKQVLPYLKTKAKHAELAVQFQEKKRANRWSRRKPIPTAVLEAEAILASNIHSLNRRCPIG